MNFQDDINELSVEIANDYPGWEFKSGMFKNRELQHSTQIFDPFWHFRTKSFAPSFGLHNLRVKKLWEKLVGKPKSEKTFWSGMFDKEDRQYRIHLLDSSTPLLKAEVELRKAFDLAIDLIAKTYNLSSEEALFRDLPKFWEQKHYLDDVCTKYFIAKMTYGETHEASKYLEDQIETARPKRKRDIEKVIYKLNH